MAESHVISGLVAKRSELAGLIDSKQREIDRMLAQLCHLDATIKLFDPDYDLKTIKGKRHYKKSHLFKHGECYRLVLEALRNVIEPTDTATMTAMVMKAKGFCAEQQPCAYSSVLTALNAARKNGIVIAADKQGTAILWRLA